MLLRDPAGLPYLLEDWFWRVRNAKDLVRTIRVLA